ncbi:hypothetical protein [Intrasporangium calvum]|uniref:Pilus assembly protein CpaE n=1 Tax=Intrasporangium calvum (strain ATCC 23552 / DSM 43043 / JCM 3097 / NBRC 12989 / NCIMB 10167 / NRRL B-3866 / 7 KIP) TaxID=710696 RepID=E6S6H4_INTC7|nr:hypothetical protein [Intrasporangium calvum]ADU48963.1 hypothetical protein Intca_2456 [Intrasporangium calvum DSM 43043]AXG13932.1 hypothetical protein DN585_11425 [Intrasporangium calvum]
MISLALARRLVAEGVLWEPRPGDRFMIDQPTLVDDVFWISELTIDVHTYHGQPLLGFNGTTEWALDSVTLDKAIWLPREDQLRELLGQRFVALSRPDGRWRVSIVDAGGPCDFEADDPEDAYALALLSIA